MKNELILVPTSMELQRLEPRLAPIINDNRRMHVCGFGPIAAAARTSQLIAQYRPTNVMLIGIAGSYDGRQTIGTALIFNQVACYGIGAGTGNHHVSAGRLGWPQWPNSDSDTDEIGDLISLSDDSSAVRDGCLLLTCCAASACRDDVGLRLRNYPNAVAEDMEGFGVAMSCVLAGVKLSIIRGISNAAGERNKDHWRIEDALDAAAELALQVNAKAES